MSNFRSNNLHRHLFRLSVFGTCLGALHPNRSDCGAHLRRTTAQEGRDRGYWIWAERKKFSRGGFAAKQSVIHTEARHRLRDQYFYGVPGE